MNYLVLNKSNSYEERQELRQAIWQLLISLGVLVVGTLNFMIA
jgi:hypothetical protein